MGTGKLIAGGNPAMDWHPIQEGFEILLVASCYRNWDKLLLNGPLSLSLPWSHFVLMYLIYSLTGSKVCFKHVSTT